MAKMLLTDEELASVTGGKNEQGSKKYVYELKLNGKETPAKAVDKLLTKKPMLNTIRSVFDEAAAAMAANGAKTVYIDLLTQKYWF